MREGERGTLIANVRRGPTCARCFFQPPSKFRPPPRRNPLSAAPTHTPALPPNEKAVCGPSPPAQLRRNPVSLLR
jgi:hypothetical protein